MSVNPMNVELPLPATSSSGGNRKKLRRQESMADKTKAHLKKHKVKHGICWFVSITTLVIVLIVTLMAAAYVAYNHYNRAASSAELAAQAKAEGAVVNIGQQSVLPPKDDDDDTARRLADSTFSSSMLNQVMAAAANHPNIRGLAAKMRGLSTTGTIDTSTFNETSDYRVTNVVANVRDGMGQSLRTVNMLLCFLQQTSAGDFFNKGPFIANVDETACQQQEGGGGDDSQNRRIIRPWSVVATGPNATTPEGLFEVSAWLTIPAGRGEPMELEFKMEVEKSKILEKKDGSFYPSEFRVQFRTKDPEAPMQYKGVIETTANGNDRLFNYVMSAGGEQEMGPGTTGQMQMSQAIFSSYNNETEVGFAKTSDKQDMLDKDGKSLMEGGRNTQNSVGWNGVYFKKSGTVCLDRKNNVPVGQSYRLYDEKGKAIDVESYIRVQVTVPEDNGLLKTVKGQILEASMHDGGMYFDNEWDHDTQKQKYTNEEAEAIFAKYFKTGVTVHETEYGENGPEAGDESFTLSIIPGSMEVTTKRIKSMDAIPAGQEFKLYAYHDCPENTLRFRQGGYHVQTMVMFEKGEWYDVKKEKGVMQKECNTSQPDNGGPQNYQYQPPVFEVIQKTVHVFKEWEQGMDVYSEVDGTNGFIAKDKKSEMQWSSRRNLKPTVGGKQMTLYCLERCIDPNKLAEEKDREYCLTINSDGNEERRSPIPGNCDSQQGRQCTCPEGSYLRTQEKKMYDMPRKQPKYRAYCRTTKSDGTEERRSPTPSGCDFKQGECTCPKGSYLDQQEVPNGFTKSDAKKYTFDKATGLLYADGSTVPLVYAPPSCTEEQKQNRQCNSNDIRMNLVADIPETWTAIASCLNVDDWECRSSIKTRYTWSTGSRWNRVTYLTDSNDQVRMPVGEKKLSFTFPDRVVPTLSGKNYAHQEIVFTYQNGHVRGLPEVCMDAETFEMFEGKKQVHGGIMHLQCYGVKVKSDGQPQQNVWQTADVLVPQGSTVTEMNEDTGLLTHYVLKATSVTQMMKAADVSQCVDVKFAPDGTEVPTTKSQFGTMVMADYPTETLVVKVEAGVVLVDTESENEMGDAQHDLPDGKK